MEYEGSNHIKNPEMQRVLLTHEVICRYLTILEKWRICWMGRGWVGA